MRDFVERSAEHLAQKLEEERRVEDEARTVYQLATGAYDYRNFRPLPWRVENMMADGQPCMDLYGEMLDAYDRLCQRLHPGEEEDEDVEILFDSLFEICMRVGMRMYAHGRYYALHPDEIPQRIPDPAVE